MRIPTRTVGDASAVKSRLVSTKPCKLFSILGQNLNAATRYIQVHETAVVPAAGATAKFSIPVAAAPQYYAWDLSSVGVDLDACTVVVSTDASTYVDPAANDATIQAVLLG